MRRTPPMKAQQAAEAAVGDAAGSVPGPPPVSGASTAGCGPFSLRLVLDLEGGALLLDAVVGDLDDALEPRLVSERRAEDV